MKPAEPGQAVKLASGHVGIAVVPGQRVEGVCYEGPSGEPCMTHGRVFVRPVMDVRKHSKVVALAGGALGMRRSGRLPKGAVVLHDARWDQDGKAGELVVLEMGVATGTEVDKLLAKTNLRIRREP